MVDIALKNLWARRTRSLLTVLGVAVCVMLYLFMAGTTTYVESNLEKEMAKYAGQIYIKSPAVSLQSGGVEFPPISSVIDSQTAERILEETPGINRERSIPILFKALTAAVYPGGPRTLAVGLPAGKEEIYIGKTEAAIGNNRLTSNTAAEAILGKAVAESFKAEAGKTISIAGENILVRGILETSEIYAIDYTILLPLDYAQNLFQQKDSVSVVLLSASSVSEVETVASAVKSRFPKLETMSQKEMASNMADTLTGMHTFFGGIEATAILVAVVVVLVVMVMAVSERTREIGTLRAIGARKRTVLGLIVQESFILSLLGGVLGVVFGYLMNAIMYKGLIVIEAAEIPQGIIIAVIAGVIGGIYPAWRATRVDPLEALRYE
jgi:putative ABC transport system permease protein